MGLPYPVLKTFLRMLTLRVQTKELIELGGRHRRNEAFDCTNRLANLLERLTLTDKLEGITRDVVIKNHIQIHTKPKRLRFEVLDIGSTSTASHQTLELGERLARLCISIHCIPHSVTKGLTANAFALVSLLFVTFIIPIILESRNQSTKKDK